MEREYKPSSREVTSEIVDGIKNYPYKEKLENFLVPPLAGVASVLLGNLSLYALPTVFRDELFGEKKPNENEVSQVNPIVPTFFLAAIPTTVWMTIEQASFYKDNPGMLAIPAITNIVSGLYEVYSSAEKRVQSKFSKDYS